ncbi:MAG TPA: SAF domain-containing protein [Candidatus Eisenbacteria bacterium]|nr:SAF domain-containing protein [Candidatus Eisenbacteria bacterium]
MEMEYGDGGRRGKFVIVIGVLLALIAGATSWYLINQAQQSAGQGSLQKVSVVVATKDIAARIPVVPDDVALREIPLDAVSQNGTLTKPEDVVGKVLAVPALMGQPIYSNMILSAAGAAGFSILGPDETVGPDSEAWRAVSITIPDARAVGGVLSTGQTVDIFMTSTISVVPEIAEEGLYYTAASTKVTYQDVVILARTGEIYIIRVSLRVGEEIAHLMASGTATFSAVLRPDEDVRILDVSSLGATTNRIIERYGLPLPQLYPQPSGPINEPPPIVPVTPAPQPEPQASAAP